MKALLEEMESYALEHHIPIIRERERHAFCRIVEEAKPHRILEIGTAIGYSAILMAMFAAEDVEVVSLERMEDRAAKAEEFIGRSPYRDCIKVMTGDAADLLGMLQGSFDFVFIDAAKGQYARYFRRILPMLSARAVVLADNVLFRGYVCSDVKPPRRYKTIVKRLREYLDLVRHTPGFATELLEDGDGMAVSRRLG